MEYSAYGKIIKGVGGRYFVRLASGDDPLSGELVPAKARGSFRHDGVTPLVGDNVGVTYTERSVSADVGAPTGVGDAVISSILERKNSLIRPPIANIDIMLVSMAASSPEPMPEMTDKLLSILEFNDIEPVVVIEKCELDREKAEELREIYTLAGYDVFVLSCRTGEGVDALKSYVCEKLAGRTAAFAGASGVGKSTLMNTLFPDLFLETSDVSRKTERGRHTTRHVELYPVFGERGGYIADTPGFSMLDFVRFDFFTSDDLPLTMREFEPYLGKCRYTKCTHTKEEGCAVLEALRDGRIAKSRHDSFVSMYDVLKEKKAWMKKS